MSGPFPGMDPYLEHPARWPGLHQRLITYSSDTLNEILPSHYVADIGERLYIVQPERSIYPDVVVVESLPPPSRSRQAVSAEPVATSSDAPWVVTTPTVEVREVFIEILLVPDENRLITGIEILSPTNKAANSDGRRLYLAKQQEMLASPSHLIEIDLLRQGEHTVAAPYGELRKMGTWDYLVCLHRGGDGLRYEVWPNTVRQRLPRIRVPLTGSDPDLTLDLQSIFDRCYDAGPYSRRVDYRREPPSPLSSEDAEWAHALLRDRGLRG
jgi:hypothetical protein